MSIYEHATYFAGKQVVNWDKTVGVTNPETCIYRFETDLYSTSGKYVTEALDELLEDSHVGEVTGLVIGAWSSPCDEPTDIIEWLCSAHEKLPNLTAIFFGDITPEESEISWIEQADISPLFIAYPALEHFRVRGGTNLRLGHLRHEHLKSLTIETGGLDRTVVQDILASHLPHLEHLELWLGARDYGANTEVVDFEPLFNESLFPKLRYLGLRDSEIANELAIALVRSPLIERIRISDLSMGLLDDTGAIALLHCPAVSKLEKLDIQYHYCSDEMVERLETLPIEVDASEKQQPSLWGGEEHRYVAISE